MSKQIGILCDKCKKVVIVNEGEQYGHLLLMKKQAFIGTATEPIKEKAIFEYEFALCPNCLNYFYETFVWKKEEA